MPKTETDHSEFGCEVELCAYDKQAEILTRWEVEQEASVISPRAETLGMGCYLTLPADTY